MTADAVAELARINEQVKVCTRCDLHRAATLGVPGEGPSNADIMLVGEGPGFNEDKQGRPFVGAAGKFLEELLGIAGLTRSEVYITNVIKHRPPNNRDPLPDELGACLPYLKEQIAVINPRLIVTLGRFSLATFFSGSAISKWHGELRQESDRYFFHMYHPAAALHQDKLRQTIIEDMKKLAKFIRGPFASPAEVQPDDADEEPPAQLTMF